MWDMVELRDIRVFLTLAEELHFGRTAERMHLTPSRVSQTLRDLERKLGAQLVHRTSRRVELTPRGAAFLSELRPAYDHLAATLAGAEASARAMQGVLRLGLFSGPSGGSRLIELVRAFEGHHPGAHVEVSQVSWDDPLGPLRANEVELMASWLPLQQPDLVVGPVLATYPRMLAVSLHHPFAARERVLVEELAGERIARFSGWPRELEESFSPPQTPSGRPLAAMNVPAGGRSQLGLSMRIARGEILHLTVPPAAPHPDIAYVAVDGLPPLSSALVWRRRERNPQRTEFVRIARTVLNARP